MKLILRAIAVLSFIVSIVWMIVQPSFDPLLAILAGVTALISSFVVDKPKGGTETFDLRYRRIMLNHVEEFWVKGILNKSLYGAALLELGIKENPEAVKYPWSIKKEANKTLIPFGKPMLEIFEEVGLGRSLLILGAPGSGKTTMLLELTLQLIDQARQEITEPIPVVFNLSSWTERLTLAEWLARELHGIYAIPKNIGPVWVKENKMFLLLDGLDEVQQGNREKCIDAINHFRKENGLTCMAVCSRVQDYGDLKKQLSFEGAIEIQPLTSNQVNCYFRRFGNQMAGIRQVLENDAILREIAKTPLFLSIMTLAYRNTKSINILVSENSSILRKQLFETYIERMFERPERSKNEPFKKQDVLHWLSWLAYKMKRNMMTIYYPGKMDQYWLDLERQIIWYRIAYILMLALICMLLIIYLFHGSTTQQLFQPIGWIRGKLWFVVVFTLIEKLIVGLKSWFHIYTAIGFIVGVLTGLAVTGFLFTLPDRGIIQKDRLGYRLLLIGCLVFSFLTFWIGPKLIPEMTFGLKLGLILGTSALFFVGGFDILKGYSVRLILNLNHTLPWRLFGFLNFSSDLIFLRRVGGGYIFIHRLLMDHFAEMYKENS